MDFSGLGVLSTGLCAYKITAYDTIAIAIKVKTSTGIPKMNQHNTAVNMISNALAKVFRIELRRCKNNAVVMPMAALLNMIAKTLP